MVPLSPLTSEIGDRFPARPQVEKLVVDCCWPAVNSSNLDQLYVLVSSALLTTCRDMTYDVKPQINEFNNFTQF